MNKITTGNSATQRRSRIYKACLKIYKQQAQSIHSIEAIDIIDSNIQDSIQSTVEKNA